MLQRLGLTPTGSPPATVGTQVAFRGRTYLAPGGATSLLRHVVLPGGVGQGRSREGDAAAVDTATLSEFGSRSVRQLVDGLSDRERVAVVLHALVRLTSYVTCGMT